MNANHSGTGQRCGARMINNRNSRKKKKKNQYKTRQAENEAQRNGNSEVRFVFHLRA